jgi:type I restriction-modification system DNA methylase subunit
MLNSPTTPEGKMTLSERRFRKGRDDFDNNKLMRYEKFFNKNKAQEFLDLANQCVPFLNGGLFDCLDEKNRGMYYDAFTDREAIQKQLIVPDYLFFGKTAGKDTDLSDDYGAKTIVNIEGIIDILKRYNFTVEENMPYDQEVSLDPELLGNVFENLLASYNPETQTTARKQTGSYYTPKEIVQFMVDESLTAYLKRKVGEKYEQVFSHLLQYKELTDKEQKEVEEIKDDVIQALYECKILDPACGSGAFPMGVLQQMVHLLNQLDPDNKQWKALLTKQTKKDAADAIDEESKEERDEAIDDVKKSFDTALNHQDYARKLYLIENCIYGVDVQSIAIQISKLRFFISLVVDQKTNNNPIDNFGIRPLPNLEAKFVAANTLIDLERRDADLFDSDAIKQKEKEMKDAKHRIFGAKTVKTKRKYKDKVAELRNEIAKLLEESGAVGNVEAKQMAQWDMFDQNSSSPFYDSEWMFGISDGFDIVIANPPYGVLFSEKEKQYFSDNYKYQDYQPESYLIFIEKGIALTERDGVLSYIIPNTWLLNLTTKKIRKHIFETTSLIGIVHFKDYVFNAIVDTEIISLIKQIPVNRMIRLDIKSYKGDLIESSTVNQNDLINKNGSAVSLFIKDDYLSLINKMSLFPCLDSFCKITQGTKPFQAGKGVPKQTKEDVKQKAFVSEVPKEGFRPLLRGSLMNRYKILWNNNYWIKYGEWLAEPRPSASYDAPEKIVIRQTGDSLIATLDCNQFVVRDNLYTCIGKSPRVMLSAILGLINSKLLNWYYQKVLNPEEGEALAQVKKGHLTQLPIAVEQEDELYSLVQKRLDVLIEQEHIDSLENEIDKKVYHLYGLTYDEVLIVDPETPITREE